MSSRPAKKLDIASMVWATTRASEKVERVAILAERIKDDTHKKARLEAHECKGCFYFDSLGGAAITTQPCACCGIEQTYSSTNTDVLCMACAKEHSLCKHCGGDLDMRPLRRKWPGKS